LLELFAPLRVHAGDLSAARARLGGLFELLVERRVGRGLRD
jgi:hypothetical protein